MTGKKSVKFVILTLLISFIFIGWAGAAQKKLVVVGWGGAWEQAAKKAFGDPFEKETGVKIIWTAPLDFGKLKSMVEAGRPEWDVIAAAGMHWMVKAEYAGLLDRIDYSIVDASVLDKQFVHEYAVGGEVESAVLTYRTDKYKKSPMGWADF